MERMGEVHQVAALSQLGDPRPPVVVQGAAVPCAQHLHQRRRDHEIAEIVVRDQGQARIVPEVFALVSPHPCYYSWSGGRASPRAEGTNACPVSSPNRNERATDGTREGERTREPK